MLSLNRNKLAQVPSLGSAPQLTQLSLEGNAGLALGAAAAARLPREAPALRELRIGGPAAATFSLVRCMPQLNLV